jgi:hypothetical protein
MLRDIFHQDTESLLPLVPRCRQGVGRNAHSPCCSDKKCKLCCLANAEAIEPRPAS